jgi:cyclophilin family peptidyl-prolyl cis-trans isomerase
VQFNFDGRNPVQVDLFDQLTPQTVNNFLQNYVNPGLYTNTIIHRSLNTSSSDIGVIQGGLFYNNTTTISTVPSAGTINLEYSRANTAGTLSMWRTSASDPNSATSIWSFNAVDNSGPLGPGGDSPSGYAVFGWIVGPGMSTITDINSLSTTSILSAVNPNFDSLPQNPDFSLVVLDSISVVKTHPAFQNPVLNTDVNNDGSLSPQDLDILLEDIALHNIHAVSGPFSGSAYLDVNGDGLISPADVLAIVDAFRAQVSPTARAQQMAAPSVSVLANVPEPSSLVLAAGGVLAFLAYSLRRRDQATEGSRRQSP